MWKLVQITGAMKRKTVVFFSQSYLSPWYY